MGDSAENLRQVFLFRLQNRVLNNNMKFTYGTYRQLKFWYAKAECGTQLVAGATSGSNLQPASSC